MPVASIGDAIEVYWPDDNEYYAGRVAGFNLRTGTHLIHYDDGEVEDLRLRNERWRRMEGMTDQFGEKLVDRSLNSTNSITTQVDTRAAATATRSIRRFCRLQSIRKSSARSTRYSKRLRLQSLPETPSVKSSTNTVQHIDVLTNTQIDVLPVRLIETCANSWFRDESRHQFGTFSKYQCLSHILNMLTEAAVNQTYQSKLLDRKVSTSNWVFSGLDLYSQRKLHDRWQQPLSNDDRKSEIVVLYETYLLLRETISHYQNKETTTTSKNPVVQAIRYVLHARESCKPMHK